MELKQVIDRITSLQEIIMEKGISEEAKVRLDQKFRLEWNFHSTHMEGNKLTIGETEQLMLHDVPTGGKPMSEYKEMQNHFDAVKYVEEIAPKNEPLNERFIKELHQILLKDPFVVNAVTPHGQSTTKRIKIGEYKSLPNHVTTITGETFHFAAPEETPAKMTELVDWFNEGEKGYPGTAQFIRAAILHHRFIGIHPFDDGNGRMARLLMNYNLLGAGFPPVVIKSDKKEEYLAALREADAGNQEAFIIYIGNQLISSLELTLKASKGESLEEPDDLDKRLLLLENRIENLDKDEIKIEKSEALIHAMVDDVLLPLAKLTDNHINPLKKYFQTYEFLFYFNGSGKFYQDIQNLHLIKVLEDAHELNPQKIEISYSLKGFKKAGTRPFQVSSSFVIEFSDYSYNIRHANTTEEYKDALYHQFPTEDEVKAMSKSMANYLTEQIGYRLDKLDKQ